MKATQNPTSHIRSGRLWGFEFEHVIVAIAMFLILGSVLNFMNKAIWPSWIFAALALVFLRILSVTKKSGYLRFLLAWVLEPHLYLGKAKGGRDYEKKI